MSDHPKLPGPLYRVSLSPASCGLDLGDGSERGEYVNQDYILRSLGRPHRSINLMYCYYPYDKGWPLRARNAFPQLRKARLKNVWVHPYDDYFPYGQPKRKGGPREPFSEIRDIRRHGQDVTLTLTFDLKTKDSELRKIARELKPYGRLRLRINHECDGFWFSFNRRYSRIQVTEFFIRFSRILKQEAPQVLTMCCWGHWNPQTKKVKFLDELSPMLRYADVWSLDKYLSLHYFWPSTDCDEGAPGYSAEGVKACWEAMREVQRVFAETTGFDKPVELGELNADGDVGGEEVQVATVRDFYRKVVTEKPRWLSGITFYQFRDRGRLGLEAEDPNHPEVGRPTLLHPEYRRIIQNPYFLPRETWKITRDRSLKWTASDDAEGLGWKVPIRKKPVFLELYLPSGLNLMVKVGRLWFYKKTDVEHLDVIEGARDWEGKNLPVAVFAPPAEGENPRCAVTVRSTLKEIPRLRLRTPWKKSTF